ncbi:MAG: DUF3240 family protein [Methylotenera sp.]|nr:DUF3240 family protein [Methylotenera sp.]
MTQETVLQNLAPQGLLILIVPPTLEEMLVDVLLQQAEISGFTSNKVSGHGTVHGDGVELSIVEQVTGRQQRVQFMMHAKVTDLQNLVAMLKAKFRSTDIHYILLPILAC